MAPRKKLTKTTTNTEEVLSETEDESTKITLEVLSTQILNLKTEISKDITSKIELLKDEFVSQLKEENQLLQKEITDLKNSYKLETDTLKKEIDVLKKEVSDLTENKANDSEFIEVERDCAELQQYTRRNNIEICGIPTSVSNDKLEDKVIEIAASVDIDIQKSDIEACHRLHKRSWDQGPARTIVRFVNRKHAEKLLRKNKEFSKPSIFAKAGLSQKIYINNNLCSYYRFLWGKVKILYNQRAINSFWVYNGNIYIKFLDDDDSLKVTHINDLLQAFPDQQDLLLPQD